MKFDYNELKIAERNGTRLGNWKGLPVFACSKENVRNKGNGAYYIIYDDNNAIVRIQNGKHIQYGRCDSGGNVDEFSKLITYKYEAEEPTPAPVTATASSTFGYEESVDVDFKMNNDVESVLKQAREMTIDSLLEGFDYGLVVAKE